MTATAGRHHKEAEGTAESTGEVGEQQPTRTKSGRGRRMLKRVGLALLALLMVLGLAVAFFARRTENQIEALRDEVTAIGGDNPSPLPGTQAMEELPAPVQRYFDYVFVEEVSVYSNVVLTSSGEFRRPLTEGFNPVTAEQTIAVGTPALMFSAKVDMAPLMWARAYDFYAEGTMEMKAKINSTLTVVTETETPELNQTSLQRWLLESPLYPMALLPGGAVQWEAIDATHARAVVSSDGVEASLVATFGADGSLTSFDAEEDGDLTTSYHGSGEHGERSDYRLVDGIMIPHSFSLGRAAEGEIYPFFEGQIETISFQ